MAIWAIGIIALLLIWLTRELRTRLMVRASEASSDSNLLRILAESKANLGINREVRLIKLQSPHSPALTGVFRPVIAIGRGFETELCDEQIEHVFLHELAHLKRGDLLTRILMKIAFILHWPNPVAWWLAKVSHEDVEIATDDLVLQHLPGAKQRHSYGSTLLQVARSLSQSNPILKNHLLGITDPYQSNLETRIQMIANHATARKSKGAVFLAIASATALSLLLGFKPAAAQSAGKKSDPVSARSPEDKTQRVRELEQKLKTIILPSVDFSDTKLGDALGVIQKISRDIDESGPGVTISIREEDRKEYSDVPITLRLSNVPLSEALRYITSLSQTRYHLTPNGVVVRKTPRRNELYTNLYVVPPTFSTQGANTDPGDPFAVPAKSKPLNARLSAKEILESAGIIFGPGASAVYNPSTSQLIVRNNQDQMELVEVYLKSIKTEVEKQIHLRAMVFVSKEPQELVLPGGVRKLNNKAMPPTEKKPVGIVRSFDDSKSMREFLFSDDIEKQIAATRNSEKRKMEIGAENFSLTGILTTEQRQSFLEKSRENPDISISELPGAMVRSGHRTVIAGETVAIGLDPVLGADYFTIDLNLMSRFLGEHLPEVSNQTSHQATIWDGQSVVLAGKRDRDHHLLLVITAQIVDPAGEPIARSNKKKPGLEKDRAAFLKQVAEGWENPALDWQANVRMADELALEASRLLAKNDHEGAERKYREALKLLPDRPETDARQKSYLKQWFKALKQME